MTDKEKIRAEIIKRRKAILKEEDDKRMKAVYGGIIFELREILKFIDSLPVEPKFKVGDVVRSKNDTILTIIGLGQYCYHCDNDYSFGFNIQDEFELVEKPISEDLKKASEEYTDSLGDNYPALQKAFKAGGQWQKQQIIGKACEWVRTHRDDDFFELVPEYNYCGAGNLNIDKMVEEFRKYLEEEL